MTVFPNSTSAEQMPTASSPAASASAKTTPVPAQRRRLSASGPGVRWTLSRELRVRFAKDLARIHTAEAPYRNFVKLAYSGPVTDRPSDGVLETLVKLAAGSPDDPALKLGRRCWLLTQTSQGWTLALEMRGGPHGRTVTPGKDADGVPLGVTIDLAQPSAVVDVARALLDAALDAAENPERTDVHPVVLQQLKNTW